MSPQPTFQLKNSISTQMLKRVFGIYFVIALIVTVVHMVAEYYNTQATILKELEVLTKTFEPGLATSLWDQYLDPLQSTTGGLLTLPSVVGIRVVDDQNQEVATAGILPESDLAGSGGLFGITSPLRHTYKGKEREVGKIMLYSSSQIVFQRVQLGFGLILVNAIIKTIALWIIFLWVGTRLLANPLSRLIAVARRVKLHELENLRVDTGTPYNNELKVLEETFNLMIRDLHDEISEHRQAQLQLEASQAELLEYKDHLEELVEARTKELQQSNDQLQLEIDERKLTETKLRNTQDQLIQSSKLASLGEMSTGIAHEINQPLQVISINAENLIDDFEEDLYDQAVPMLENIIKHVDRASKITNHLRTFGRDARRSRGQTEAINNLIEETFILMNAQLMKQHITVKKELGERLPMVPCHRIQIEQVFTNLLTNSKDALEEIEGDKIITVRSLQEGDWIVVEVEDNGPGIPKEVLPNIFDPFFTTKPVGKGTGLGLSISYGIIGDHHGQLNVISESGKGACFRVCLPLEENEEGIVLPHGEEL